MKSIISQPIWISQTRLDANDIKYSDLLMPIDCKNCIGCHESYIVNDPLNICKDDFLWGIYKTYFNFSEGIYSFWSTIWTREREIIRDSFNVVQEWLNRFKNDLNNKKNLYERFLDVHTQKFASPFYDKEEFYDIAYNFFSFYIRFWESVEQLMSEADSTNSEDWFEKVFHEIQHLLDNLKGKSSMFGSRELSSVLKDGEIMPYIKSFVFRWERIVMRKNANISQARLQEIYALKMIEIIQNRRREEIEKENEIPF